MAPSVCVLAQPVPGSESKPRETLPPPPPTPPPARDPEAPASPDAAAPASISFMLKRVRFAGVSSFPESDLQALVADRIGKPTTLADLEAIANRVTELYRSRGYVLAVAVVPAQEVTDGNVEISVLEGALGSVKVEIDPAAPITAARVRATATRLVPGRPLQQDALSRTMLLLSDLPGIAVQADLESGDSAGTTDLTINVKPTREWEMSFDADNHGARSVGEYRAGVQARRNSPTGIGDNFDARLQLGSGGGLTFGRVAYERPMGTDGHRATLSYYRLQYALGQDFAALDATGNADVVDFTWAYPFIRLRSRNLVGQASLQYKKLQDRFGAFSIVNDKSIRGLVVGASYEASDRLLGGGFSNASLSVLLGDLNLDTPRQREDDAQTLRTSGRFAHWNYAASRLNELAPALNLFLGLAGQLATKNLDSVEKVALGGPRAVRAYGPSEATADDALIVNLELRYSLEQNLSLQAFHDWGWARINHDPPDRVAANSVQRRGYGVGAFWGAQGFTLRGSLAWRSTGPSISDTSDRNPRLYLQVSKAL